MAEKIRVQLLQAYKKANKERKKVLLARGGYKSEEDFIRKMIAPEKKKRGPYKGKDSKTITPQTSTSKLGEGESAVDYVIAFDTTSSMASYIDSVRNHVQQLVKDLFSNTKDLMIKIVAFGDYCDMTGPGKFDTAYQEIELTNDQNSLIKFIKNAKDTSGCDPSEFYELVIRKINRETQWREGAKHAVLLIGDNVPHEPNYTYPSIFKGKAGISWQEEAKEAKNKGIQYDTLRIHAGFVWYKKLSDITGGICMTFANAAKISQVVEGAVGARASKTYFATSMDTVLASGDKELIGAYKTMSTLLDPEEGK